MDTKTEYSYIGVDSRDGRYMIGNDEHGLVPPGASVVMTARPQRPFRAARMFVWSMTAPLFLLRDLRFHTNVISASWTVVPAEMFATRLDRLPELDALVREGKNIRISLTKGAEEFLGVPIAAPLLMPGMELFLEVENVGDKAARFVAGFLGVDDGVRPPSFASAFGG
jgi:hypothetical protein